jgi:alpha-galactosidase/6-phospho-beta-glucosidase family protein
MDHLRYDQALVAMKNRPRPPDGDALERHIASDRAHRAAIDRQLASYLDRDLDDEFWRTIQEVDVNLECAADDIFLRILRGIAGPDPVALVTSYPNYGAIAGIDHRTVVEYSQTMANGRITPAANLSLPPVVGGMVTSLALHQTMLADAIATRDPRLLAHALLIYPWMPYTKKARAFYRELICVNAPDIPEPLRRTVEFLR